MIVLVITGAAAIVAALITAVASLAGYGISARNASDLQEDAQDFNSDEADESREWEFSQERYNQMTSLGFNPDLIANSMLGNSGSSSVAASSGIGSSHDLGGTLASMFGSAGQSLTDLLTVDGINEKNRSEANINNVESFWRPLTYDAQIKLWSAYGEEAKSNAGLHESLSKYWDKCSQTVIPMSQAQISEMRAKTAEAWSNAALLWEKINTEETIQDFYSTEADANRSEVKLNNSQVALNDEIGKNYAAHTALLKVYKDIAGEDLSQEKLNTLMLGYDQQIRQSLYGLPIPDDVKVLLFLLEANPNTREIGERFEDAYFGGARRLYDEEVDMQFDNFWRNFANGLDAGDVVPNMWIPLGRNGMTSKAPKAVGVDKKFSKSPSFDPHRPANTKPWEPSFDAAAYQRYVKNRDNGSAD